MELDAETREMELTTGTRGTVFQPSTVLYSTVFEVFAKWR